MLKQLCLLFYTFVILAACSPRNTVPAELSGNPGYTRIDQETARKMMEEEDDLIVVDVRRQDEYDAGHIPGAVLIPNESIGTEMPEALPDLEQIILVYCRSGNRSKQAAQKLADLGYKNVYEFGGIDTWPGEIVLGEDPLPDGGKAEAGSTKGTDSTAKQGIWTTGELPVSVRYDRMWIYSDYVESQDPEMIAALVAAIKALEVGEATEMAVTDYTDLLTFTFADGTKLRLEFEAEIWVAGKKERYEVKGLGRLRNILDIMLETKQPAGGV